MRSTIIDLKGCTVIREGKNGSIPICSSRGYLDKDDGLCRKNEAYSQDSGQRGLSAETRAE